MATAVEMDQLVVGLILHELEQFRVFTEEILPQIRAALGLVRLEVAVDALFHAFQQ